LAQGGDAGGQRRQIIRAVQRELHSNPPAGRQRLARRTRLTDGQVRQLAIRAVLGGVLLLIAVQLGDQGLRHQRRQLKVMLYAFDDSGARLFGL